MVAAGSDVDGATLVDVVEDTIDGATVGGGDDLGAWVIGTRTAGTSSVSGWGAGRTARYSSNVVTNAANTTTVERRTRPISPMPGRLR